MKKYKWKVIWNNGQEVTCVYFVERKNAERGAYKYIENAIAYSFERIKPVQILFIPEEE